MKKQISVVGAVVVRDDTVLAAQRSADMSLPGSGSFPAEKSEAGETPQEGRSRAR